MHSLDPEKGREPLLTQFREKFELEIMTCAAGMGTLDCTRFVFPDINVSFHGRLAQERCIFVKATFWGTISFLQQTFEKGADFNECIFQKDVSFRGAVFITDTTFESSQFRGTSDFIGAEFQASVTFAYAHFGGRAAFRTIFDEANFKGAMFGDDANFSSAKFGKTTSFTFASFRRVTFAETEFATIDFSNALFASNANFRKTKFSAVGNTPSAVFEFAVFSEPEKISFVHTDLRNVLFSNCDLSKVRFSDVIWRTRPYIRKRMLLEEVVSLDDPHCPESLKTSTGGRNYNLIAELYRQLEKVHDDQLDYNSGGDFHYGDIEMRRLAGRWFHRHFGIEAWYLRVSHP